MTKRLQALDPREREAFEKQAANIKLAFFDIDGTLLDSNAQLPESARQAIAQLQTQGVTTAVASGRPLFAAQQWIDALKLDGAGLFCTGALVYDPKQQQELTSAPLPFFAVQNLVDMARATKTHCELYTDRAYHIESTTEFTELHNRYLRIEPELGPFDARLLATPIYKVQLVFELPRDEPVYQSFRQRFPELVFAAGHGADRPEVLFASVVAAEACKQQAFNALCAYHGVSADQVLSLGDAGSDKVFLREAGLGIAMGNAVDEVQAEANYVTAHVDEGGLAMALNAVSSALGSRGNPGYA